MTLADDVRSYLNLSHAFAWHTAQTTHPGKALPPDEPALVSAFLDTRMYLGLQAILRKRLPPSNHLLVNGIFTHQTPKVKRTSGGNAVEIGDLLLVQQHINPNSNKPDTGRALLLQAKKVAQTNTGPLTAGNDPIQYDLYANWPSFNGYTRIPQNPNNARSGPWDFKNPSAGNEPWSSGAQYLIVFDGQAYDMTQATPAWQGVPMPGPAHPALQNANFPGLSTWVNGSCASSIATSASAGVNCPDDFADTFEAFLKGQVGRAFQPGILAGPDHWSVFINLMLKTAANPGANYLYNLRRIGAQNQPRGRILNYLSAFSAWQLAQRQAIDLVEGVLKEDRRESIASEQLATINALVRVLNSLERPGLLFKGPRPPSPESLEEPDGGHVPLLVITTIGDEPPHFE